MVNKALKVKEKRVRQSGRDGDKERARLQCDNKKVLMWKTRRQRAIKTMPTLPFHLGAKPEYTLQFLNQLKVDLRFPSAA